MSDQVPAPIYLRIDLEQDVVLSGTAASTGLHQTLDHIPGSVLLGLAAAAYATIDTQDPDLSWSVFHGGGVRFGDGLPFREGDVFIPAPASLQGQKLRDSGGLVSASGRRIWPERRYRRRTAIDPVNGRALEMALFGYTSLKAGQSFVSRLDIAPGCAAVQDAILSALTAAPVWIGRSRGAEYGRVRITRLAVAPVTLVHGPLDRGLIEFIAVSDCAFPGGGLPSGKAIGLPEDWTPAPEISAHTWRRYTLFNQYRRAFDPERVVLAKGSRLAFRGNPLNTAAQQRLLCRLDAGVGLFTAEGLGVIVANPTIFDVPPEGWPKEASRQGETDAPAPDDSLFLWLWERHGVSRLGTLAREVSQRYERQFASLYRELWREGRLTGRAPNEAAPSRAQWGNVREEGLRAASLAALMHQLFNAADGVCSAGTGGARWREEAPSMRLQDSPASAAALLQQAIEPSRLEALLDGERQPRTHADALAHLIIADLAVQVPRVIDELQKVAE